MDNKKIKDIGKKIIIFLNIILNMSMFLCCYLTYISITKGDVRLLFFALSMIVVNIFAFLYIKNIQI